LPEVVCDTSPLQYLHQLGLLHILPALAGRVLIPPAVAREIEEGVSSGVDLPDLRALEWLKIRVPAAGPLLPLEHDLGPGETEVFMLAGELADVVVVLDDGLARRVADHRKIPVIGTLGLLLNAKRARLVASVKAQIDRLQAKRFRVSPMTRAAVLELAGEQE
jgi:predicted nucleic acid-binding protein